MRNLRKSETYSIPRSKNSGCSYSQIYKNVQCFTQNDGQSMGSFPRFPTCFTMRDLFDQMIDSYSAFQIYGAKSETNDSMEWISYSDFGELVFSFVHKLKKMGIKQGDNVIVYIKNSVYFALAQWALAYFGAVMIPISVDYLKPILYQVSRIFNCKLLICSNDTFSEVYKLLSDKIPDTLEKVIIACDGHEYSQVKASFDIKSLPNGQLIVGLESLLKPLKKKLKLSPIYATHPCVINFGESKGGILKPSTLTHANLIAASAGIISCEYNFRREVYFSVIHMSKVYERSIQLFILAYGGSIGFHEAGFWEGIKLIRPTIMSLSGTQMGDMAEVLVEDIKKSSWLKRFGYDFAFAITMQSDQYGLKVPWFFDQLFLRPFQEKLGGRIRLLISSISSLQPRVQNMLRVFLHIPVIQAYGTTETGGLICIQSINDTNTDKVGPPCVTCEICLRDFTAGHLKLNQDEPGEILVRGSNVFSGYSKKNGFNNSILIEDGWFPTGDLGKISPEGTIELCDTICDWERRKSTISGISQYSQFV